MDDGMEKLHVELSNFVTKSILDGNSPFVVAAVLSTLALSIYKTCLDEVEYNKMVDAISNSRNRVQSFGNKDHTIQ